MLKSECSNNIYDFTMKFYRKILSVIASMGILSGINNANEFNALSGNSNPVLHIDGNVYVSHYVGYNFSYQNIMDRGLNNDYAIFNLPQVIPGNITIGDLLQITMTASNDLNDIRYNSELDDNYKRRLMATILNMLETIVYPIERVQNIVIHNDDPLYSSSGYYIIFLADSISSFNNFDMALQNFRNSLYDFPNNYLNITVAQTNDYNFLTNLRNTQQNNNIILT